MDRKCHWDHFGFCFFPIYLENPIKSENPYYPYWPFKGIPIDTVQVFREEPTRTAYGHQNVTIWEVIWSTASDSPFVSSVNK